MLVDAGEPRNRWTRHVHGYLGIDPVAPAELLDRARDHLEQYATVERREGRVATATAAADGFEVTLDGGGRVTARRLVLATGARDEFPEVDGFFDHYGRDVFHCPACDGFESRGRRVAVFGWSGDVAGFALGLLDWATSVTIVTEGRTFDGDAEHREALARHGVPVVEDDAVALEGAPGELRAVRLRGGDTIGCDAAFFSIAHHPVTDLAQKVGCEVDEEGYVVVDHKGQTTVPGVYAAGDLTPGTQLVQVAASQGAEAGVCCAVSLRGEPLSGAPPRAPDAAGTRD